MYNTGLNQRLRKHAGDRLGKALQAIDDGDQDIVEPTRLQIVHDLEPEFGASVCSIQRLRTSFSPDGLRPNATYIALFLTVPSSRILTRRASKKTTGYTGSSGRFCQSRHI